MFTKLKNLLLNINADDDEVKALLAQGAKVVDARASSKFFDGHALGAISAPATLAGRQFVEREVLRITPSLTPPGNSEEKSGPVVVYCEAGAEASIIAGGLRRAGFENVTNAGGLERVKRLQDLVAEERKRAKREAEDKVELKERDEAVGDPALIRICEV